MKIHGGHPICGNGYFSTSCDDAWTNKEIRKCKHCLRLLPAAIKLTIVGYRPKVKGTLPNYFIGAMADN